MEAPLHYMPVPMKRLNDMFNLTMSYLNHTDTDIYTPIGTMKPRAADNKYTLPTVEFIENKTKMAAWVVSNCNSKGERERYVRALSKYIQVDIYGKCGLKCTRANRTCFDAIERNYKFYLAFESMFCDQYVTEKLFRTLSYDIIPVTLGDANYSRHAPPNSYVNVRDFKSPRELADFLIALSKDYKRYLEYFKWKKQWIFTRDRGLCELCEILHTESYTYKTRFNMQQYWNSTKYCKHGKAEMKLLHLD
jgi:hypothetical protein